MPLRDQREFMERGRTPDPKAKFPQGVPPIEESLPHHSNRFHVYFVAPLPPGHPIERRELDEARRPLG